MADLPRLPKLAGNYELKWSEEILLQRNLNVHDVHTDPQTDLDHLVVSVTVHGEAHDGPLPRPLPRVVGACLSSPSGL